MKSATTARKIKHVGLHANRTRNSVLERVYAGEWERIAPSTLGYIIGDQCGDYSARDAEVAASIIQWLGSPVGRSFVYDVLCSERLKA